MQIRPLHDRVIIKRLAAETTTSFGIVIPDSAGEKPDQGEVIAFSLASTPARPSRSTAKSCSSCAKKTSWASSPNQRLDSALHHLFFLRK